MIKVLEAKDIALEYVQLLEDCQGKNAENVKKESISDYMEVIVFPYNGVTHEFQLRKNSDGNYISASLNSFIKVDKQIVYINKNIIMDFQEDGRKVVTIRDPKSNSKKSWIASIEVDKFGEIKGTNIHKDIKVTESVGIGMELMSKVLRSLRKHRIKKIIKMSDSKEKSMC